VLPESNGRFSSTPFHKNENVDLISGLEFSDALKEYYRHEREAAPVMVKDKIMGRII
jgi:amino acid transporter